MGQHHEMRVVGEPDGLCDVVAGNVVLASGLASNAAAWTWIDRHSISGQADTELHQRIRQGMSAY